jgi:hypothetical protein
MKLFNVLLILSIVLFFTLKNINDRNNDDIKLYLIGVVLENNPDLSEFELEARVNKLFDIVKGR